MGFNENIGKFVKLEEFNENLAEGEISPRFLLIIGFDFLRGQYIVNSLWKYGKSLYLSADSTTSVYTLEEARAILNAKAEEADARAKAFRTGVMSRETLSMVRSCPDLKNEFHNLFRRYKELNSRRENTVNRRKNIQMYCSNRKEILKAYDVEIRHIDKALRRLDKRFHFFFGDNADALKDALDNAPNVYISGGCELDVKIEIERLEAIEEALLSQWEEIGNLAEKWNSAKKSSD